MDFFVGNFADWFNSYAKDKLFRLWYKEDENLIQTKAMMEFVSMFICGKQLILETIG